MYTNGTTNYNLPQYVDSDKATWTDLNAPFNQIDAAIKAAVDDTAQEALDIDALKSRMNTAEQNIGTNTTDIAGLDNRLTTTEGAVNSLSGQVADTRQDLEDMICAYNESSATSTHAYAIGDYFIYNDVLYKATQAIAIGDTIVPDNNCSSTNVTTELLTGGYSAIKTVAGDGVKTQGICAAELLSDLTFNDLLHDQYMVVESFGSSGNATQIIMHPNLVSADNNAMYFTSISIGKNPDKLRSYTIAMREGVGLVENINVSSAEVTTVDNSNVVLPIGVSFVLYKFMF